jgi:multidrug efflux pump subunit AcrB
MTTITTVMGLLPLIVFKDPLFYGMAVVIAFGLGIGTILTLGVVPVLYAWFLGVKKH